MNTQFLESQIFQKTHFDFLILPISALSRLASMVVTLKTPLNLQSEKQQCTVIQPDDELLVKSFSLCNAKHWRTTVWSFCVI